MSYHACPLFLLQGGGLPLALRSHVDSAGPVVGSVLAFAFVALLALAFTLAFGLAFRLSLLRADRCYTRYDFFSNCSVAALLAFALAFVLFVISARYTYKRTRSKGGSSGPLVAASSPSTLMPEAFSQAPPRTSKLAASRVHQSWKPSSC